MQENEKNKKSMDREKNKLMPDSWEALKAFCSKIFAKIKTFFQTDSPEILQSQSEFGKMPTEDGSFIRFAKFFYLQKEAHHRSLLLLLGRREFIEEYGDLARDFLNRKFKIYTFDWRGQGASKRVLNDPLKGHIDDYKTYLKDLDQFIQEVVQNDYVNPLYIFAHSMGGHLALRYVLEYGSKNFKAMILSAPMLDIRTAPYPPRIARGIARTMTMTGYGERYIFGEKLAHPEFEPFENNPFTNDVDRFSKRRKIQIDHEDYVVRGYTFGWLDATFKSISALHRDLREKEPNIPLLLLSPENDPLIKNEAFDMILKSFKNSILKIYPQTKHCLLDEGREIRTQIMQDIDDFIDQLENVPH